MKVAESRDTVLSDTNIVRPLPDLEISDNEFVWKGTPYRNSDILSIKFTATVTQNSVNGIPTGKTYQGSLILKLRSGSSISISGPGRMIKSGLKKETLDGMQKANAVLSYVSLEQRLKPLEDELARKDFFSFSGYQFNKSREVFRNGQLLVDLKDGDAVIYKEPFSITIKRKKVGLKAKLISIFSNNDIVIPLEWDQDCFLYMFNAVTGYSWKDSPPPEKSVNRRAVFYRTIVRFGANLAMADGDADASELSQLKRFFDINVDTLPDAARIFNEELSQPSSINVILTDFVQAFDDAPALKETFLVGMCTVALADGHLDNRELERLKTAASILRLGQDSLTRAFLAAGFDFEAFMKADNRGAGPTQRPLHDEAEFQVLGLKPGATREQIRVAYRELVKRYHPDRLQGQGLPKNEIEKSEKILQRINVSYEYLLRKAS